MANEQNLKPPFTSKEARELGRKGGIASAKRRRQLKTLADYLAILHWAVHRFNETVRQAKWVENHRPEVKKLEMTDGSILRGEEAENAWSAFNDNDWTCISGVVMTAEELEKELEEAGCYGE